MISPTALRVPLKVGATLFNFLLNFNRCSDFKQVPFFQIGVVWHHHPLEDSVWSVGVFDGRSVDECTNHKLYRNMSAKLIATGIRYATQSALTHSQQHVAFLAGSFKVAVQFLPCPSYYHLCRLKIDIHSFTLTGSSIAFRDCLWSSI